MQTRFFGRRCAAVCRGEPVSAASAGFTLKSYLVILVRERGLAIGLCFWQAVDPSFATTANAANYSKVQHSSDGSSTKQRQDRPRIKDGTN